MHYGGAVASGVERPWVLTRSALATETGDNLQRNVVSLRFAAFRAPERTAPLPASLSFSFRFFDRPPVRTQRAILKLEAHVGEPISNTTPRVLVVDALRGGRLSRDHLAALSPEEHLSFDCSEMAEGEAEYYAEYEARQRQVDAATNALIASISKRCPNPRCQRPTEKSGGCNHMTCPACQQHWCWLCGKGFKCATHEGVTTVISQIRVPLPCSRGARRRCGCVWRFGFGPG